MLVDQDANKDMVLFTLDEEHPMLVDPDVSISGLHMHLLLLFRAVTSILERSG
ncbi:hypothetical protein F4604DRAFT_1914354 [Suillus subluteus]|nr:hypothetical protein F4604DRAFT_1936413 [Suillus subluteus]KAG1856174.1 hypothetical protein F4604DRAFT_1932040 [Suillus subluteus]KAG1889842.1 hypothetical protein F4604DRAFT_1914354 [Suillus subluteus]